MNNHSGSRVCSLPFPNHVHDLNTCCGYSYPQNYHFFDTQWQKLYSDKGIFLESKSFFVNWIKSRILIAFFGLYFLSIIWLIYIPLLLFDISIYDHFLPTFFGDTSTFGIYLLSCPTQFRDHAVLRLHYYAIIPPLILIMLIINEVPPPRVNKAIEVGGGKGVHLPIYPWKGEVAHIMGANMDLAINDNEWETCYFWQILSFWLW